MEFEKLTYTTREGLEVGADFSGTLFGCEDQRNFNDSSFKFFSAHAHTYPTLAAGVSSESSVTLTRIFHTRIGFFGEASASLPR